MGLDKQFTTVRRAIKPGDPIVVEMPFPPSVNELFGQAPGHKRFPTARYKAWQRAVTDIFRFDPPPRMSGPVKLTFEFAEKDNRPRDVSNYVKASEDALVTHGIIEGDHNKIVRRIEALWVQGIAGVRITIARAA